MYSLATYTLHYITSVYNGRKDVCTEMETMCMCVSSWAANSAETAGRGISWYPPFVLQYNHDARVTQTPPAVYVYIYLALYYII